MNWEENLKSRPKMTIGEGMIPSSSPHLILQSPFDFGVIRNGGRRGARHAPTALLAPFKKMTVSKPLALTLTPPLVLSELSILEEFDSFQESEKTYFEKVLFEKFESLLHLGGGHDHIYPLAQALLNSGKELVIINIDAHLDTRQDQLHHSGTPFRQLDLANEKGFHLLQVGIHPYANGRENYQDMKGMQVIAPDDLAEALKEFKKRKAFLLLSLDCDGLDASFMPAVSAPNHHGLGKKQFGKILKTCLQYWEKTKTPKLYGVYEFNPIFDDLGGRAARYLASTFYEFYHHDNS